MEYAANDSEYLPSHESDGSFDEEDDDDDDEDLRPNRWRGPKSTWQQYNSQEINTVTALKEIRDRDLSVHLYNAFALKRRYKRMRHGEAPGGPVPEKDINAVTGQPVEPDEWRPQRSWTAWPMRADKVPPPGDPARLGMYDPDEKFTFRKLTRDMPSVALEEAISAEILKSAKEKFNARPWAQPSASDDEADTDLERVNSDEVSDGVSVKSPTSARAKKSQSASRSRSRPRSVKAELMSEDENMGGLNESRHESKSPDEKKYSKRRFRPTVSTNDELSYNILRPSVRHILTKLDATLAILHNAQEATLNYQSDSSNSESDASMRNVSPQRSLSRQGRQTPTTGTKKAGRPLGAVSRTRSRHQSMSEERATNPAQEHMVENQPAKPAKRGRPRKEYPRLEGETDREYAIRVARLRKQPLPVFSDGEPGPEHEVSSAAESEPGRESGNSGDGEETEGPRRGRVKKRKRVTARAAPTATREHRSSSAASSASATGRRGARVKARVGLRDWRDVLGAAAVAGFPAAAVDHAARRCADLFGQGMALQTLLEGPSASGRKPPAAWEMAYVPGMPQPTLLEEDSEDEGRPTMHGRTPSSAATPSDEAGSSQPQSASRPGSARSRSGSAAAPGAHLCSFADCPRAAAGEGFSRRHNLLRHLKLVHGMTPASCEAGTTDNYQRHRSATPASASAPTLLRPEDVDSEDEMHGAVHVDWYLRPVRIQAGWRGADAEDPKRRRGGEGEGGDGDGRARRRGRGRGRPKNRVREGGTGGADDDGDVRMGEDD
ncbi:hypothetical protein GGR52DRAFT_569868 [Hypoxylon sp. FL1284]|nr:hypothetical protein GGR52DRAFT_569868 [Hypoxylon sp. FL1284]